MESFFEKYAGILDDYSDKIGEEQLSRARHKVDPELLKEKDLGDKLTTLRKITKQTNGGLAAILQENKRTFESWVSGRYTPEGDKLKKVNKILLLVGISYIETVDGERHPDNIYNGYPVIFKLLDFNDAITLLVSYFNDKSKNIDYETGQIG